MTFSYLLRESLRQAWRQRLLTLVAVASLVLAALFGGSWALLWRNSHYWRQSVGEASQLAVYLRPGTDDAAQSAALAAAQAVSGVASVELVSPEQAEQSMSADPEVKKALDLLGQNPFPPVLKVRLRDQDPASLQAVSGRLQALDSVDDVDAGQGAVESLLKASGAARALLLWLLTLFTAGALLIVAAVLRLAAWSRRKELGIMRLVGASHAFIRAPFLLEGMLQGLLGGAVAAGLLGLTLRWLAARLAMDLQVDLRAFLPQGMDWSLGLQLSLFCGLVGLVGAAVGIATVTLAYEDEEAP